MYCSVLSYFLQHCQSHKCYQGTTSTGTSTLAMPIAPLTAGCSCVMLSSGFFVTILTKMGTSAVLLWAPAGAEVPKWVRAVQRTGVRVCVIHVCRSDKSHRSGGSWGEKPCIYLPCQFLSIKILLSLGAPAAVEEAGVQHRAVTPLCGCTGYMTAAWHNSSSPLWAQENDRLLSKYFTVFAQDYFKSYSVW